MSNRHYEWDEEKNAGNLAKHGITLEAVTVVFQDPMVYEYHDKAHSGYNKYGIWENRYIAIGWVNKVLYVVYTVRIENSDEIYRMISARKASLEEKKIYEDWCKQF